MSHFAQIDNNDIVINVIVAEQEFIDSGIVGSADQWIQTSYNTRANIHYDPVTNQPSGKPALRGNYAGIGYTYDRTNDVFYPPSPYASWTIGADTNWQWTAPIPVPSDAGTGTPAKDYIWNETTCSWDLLIVEQ